MNFKESFKDSKLKDEGNYKSIYIKNSLIEEINKIASKEKMSFNKMAIHMLEYCVKEYNETEEHKN